MIIETLYSVVSAGTERFLSSFGSKNVFQKAIERPKEVKAILEKITTDGLLNTIDSALNRLKDPMPMGYSAVGKVVEVGKGINDINVGDIVAMAGQAYHSEVNRVNRNLVVKLPNNFPDIRQASFCALGAIALQGIHQAKIEPGEIVGVIGLGLLGQITARILNAYGCDVIGYDIYDRSLDKTNLKAFILSTDHNAESITMALTKNRGVDKVLITAAANNNQPMDLAASISRDKAIICMIGVTQMNIDRKTYYDKELTFTIARSYGPGRYVSDYEEKGIDYPIGLVRFTEGRNLEEFIRLISEKRLSLSDLITHEIDFVDSASAYEMITTNKNNEKYIGILLKYHTNEKKWEHLIVYDISKKEFQKNKINLGLIGAGNFARNTLLPFMKSTNLFTFKGISTTGGPTIAQAQKVFNFDYLTNNHKDLLNDSNIDLIAISTQHNTHAKLIIEALNSGKHVYCEKPMCLTLEELKNIKTSYYKSQGELFIGFNRRYSTIIKEVKKYLSTDKFPAVYNYTVNAGYITKDHWTQNENFGGGRILGEAIHFLDLIQFLDGTSIEDISITFAENNSITNKDNSIINVKFKSGAIGSILYTSLGSKKFPKEELRVFSNGKVIEMNNYIRIKKYSLLSKSKSKFRQDKGFKEEYVNIFSSICKQKKDSTVMDHVFNLHEKLIIALEKAKQNEYKLSNM